VVLNCSLPEYYFIHTTTKGDTSLRINLNKIYFLGQKHTFWHNFSALPLRHVNFTWLSLWNVNNETME